jgi:hypothetical protein
VLPDVLNLAANIKKVSMEHYAAWSSIKKPVKEIWSKPPQDFFNVNFDAAIREDFSTQSSCLQELKWLDHQDALPS